MTVSSPLPHLVRFGREVCGELEPAERREWWLANGRGSYAAGTVAGTLTRRYHGLLVAATRPPVGRRLLLAKADAVAIEDGEEWPLHANRWAGGAVEPAGHVHLESFALDGRMPVWRHARGATRVECRVWMEPGADTTVIAWRHPPGPAGAEGRLRLRVRLLADDRDHHHHTLTGAIDPAVAADPGGRRLRVGLGEGVRLTLAAVGGTVTPDRTWYERFDLPAERERGLPDGESHLCVGTALLDLEPGAWAGIVASLDDDPPLDLAESLARFRAHDAAVLARARDHAPAFRDAPDWIDQLVLAADSFLVARPVDGGGGGLTVIAGYPWFADWGRDTMIALPGLTLATGRAPAARDILATFARFVRDGLLPNTFPEAGAEPIYNTADAALWYVEAWRAYVAATGDRAALEAVLPVLRSILEHYHDGTHHGIRVDPADGLLCAGEPGAQVTWMDAKVGDWVATPRMGKPVELNALWFNALSAAAGFDPEHGERWAERAEAVRRGFRRFVRPEGGLADVLDGPEGDDHSIRPNQILAVSLTHSPLDPAAQAAVVRECGRLLLASHGLRSLAASDPRFRPVHAGGVLERDGGYHQGPVWGWLLGHYALAEYRVTGDAAAARARLAPIRDHLLDAGLGTVSEIFDGAPPHRPRGCPAQAWSVAGVLDAWWRIHQPG